jgi:hypothetical protein
MKGGVVVGRIRRIGKTEHVNYSEPGEKLLVFETPRGGANGKVTVEKLTPELPH